MASRREWRPPRQDTGFNNDGFMALWLHRNGRRSGKFYPHMLGQEHASNNGGSFGRLNYKVMK